MSIFDFFKKKGKPSKYKIDNNLPAHENVLGHSLYKRDITGLEAYFKEMQNMERIFKELTFSIRNGFSVEKYLKEANLLDDPEIREIAARGFSDISVFLSDMLDLDYNAEVQKDQEACMEAIDILTSSKSN